MGAAYPFPQQPYC